MKRLLAILCLSAFGSGCATLPRGSVITVPNTGNNFFRSRVTVYNTAGKSVAVVPFSQGEGFVSEYRLGGRNPWCLGLCRKKIPTKVFTIAYGGRLVIPMMINTSGYYASVSVSLRVYQNKKYVGTYFSCVDVPPGRWVNYDLHFGREELQRLKSGDSGRPCQSYGWRW